MIMQSENAKRQKTIFNNSKQYNQTASVQSDSKAAFNGLLLCVITDSKRERNRLVKIDKNSQQRTITGKSIEQKNKQ
jgi:hypothetical protein